MRPEEKREHSRQPYEKPRLRVIELAAEEVLAKGCKTISATAPMQIAPPCWLMACSQMGS